jgi:DNA mismatch repair protein MSH6
MIMDSQAIENLEVTECIENGIPTVEGSLLEFVDHTKTPFGKRQIRRWLLSPLLDPVKIQDRLNAVDDLMNMPIQLDLFRDNMSKLPDLEKILSRVFVYSVKNSIKAVYFEKVQF